jgi:WS/DGAT/MGAT family acyltransferase
MHHDHELMSPVDTAWLRMESPTNLMMIGVVLIFESPIKIESLKETLQSKFLKYNRFKQKVVKEKNEKYYWVNDPHFDLDHHLHRVALPGKADKTELQHFSSDLNSTALDFTKPLWQMHLIENYNEGCALIVRIHHCIADGISLVRVMLSITDDTPEIHDLDEVAYHHEADFFTQLTGSAQRLLHKAEKLGHDIVEEGLEIIRHPGHLINIAKEGLAIGSEITRIGLLPSDPATCLKQPLGGRKSVAWANPLELDLVKSTASELSGTINDILLACATSALRTYLFEQQSDLTGKSIHVAVPFNLRPLDKPITTLGNQFGLVVVSLPIGIADPRQRYEAVRANMQELKKSYQAKVFYGLLGVLGKGPSILEKTALELLSKKASAVMTNVPGPTKSLFLAGSRLIQPMVWVPQSGEVGVGLSILSYNGTVQFGLVADKQLIPNPNVVVDYFIAGFDELQKLIK